MIREEEERRRTREGPSLPHDYTMGEGRRDKPKTQIQFINSQVYYKNVQHYI